MNLLLKNAIKIDIKYTNIVIVYLTTENQPFAGKHINKAIIKKEIPITMILNKSYNTIVFDLIFVIVKINVPKKITAKMPDNTIKASVDFLKNKEMILFKSNTIDIINKTEIDITGTTMPNL